MTTKKLSDYVELKTTQTWEGTELCALADLVDQNIVVVEMARVVFGTNIAFAFKTNDNHEFLTGSMAFVQMGEKLIASEAIDTIEKHPTLENTVIYTLLEPIEMRVEMKKSVRSGREFYVITDPL
jgi:hypothetical protein